MCAHTALYQNRAVLVRVVYTRSYGSTLHVRIRGEFFVPGINSQVTYTTGHVNHESIMSRDETMTGLIDGWDI